MEWRGIAIQRLSGWSCSCGMVGMLCCHRIRRLKPTAKDKVLIKAGNQFKALSFAVHFSERVRGRTSKNGVYCCRLPTVG